MKFIALIGESKLLIFFMQMVGLTAKGAKGFTLRFAKFFVVALWLLCFLFHADLKMIKADFMF
jgi:hypothetical protein